MSTMLIISNKSLGKGKYDINIKKTKLMIAEIKKPTVGTNINVDNKAIKQVNEFPCLGNAIISYNRPPFRDR